MLIIITFWCRNSYG